MKNFFVRHLLVATLVTGAVGATAACTSDLSAPTAAASAKSATVVAGATVALDGSLSKDPNGLALTYHWTLAQVPPGSKAELVQADGAFPWFTADVAGDYTASLVVSDGMMSSGASNVKVAATAPTCGVNPPTIASVTSTPATPGVGTAVQFAADPKDADTDPSCAKGDHLSWHWTLDAQPAGSKAALVGADGTNPSFVADVPGDYTVTLAVTDMEGSVARKSAKVSVGACGTNVPTVSAITASSTSPKPGDAVTVTATASDADTSAPCSLADATTLHWSLASAPAGSKAALENATQTSPWFKPDLAGDYVVSVFATDVAGHASAPQTVKITASSCGLQAPLARMDTTKVKFNNCQTFNNQIPTCQLNQTSVSAYSSNSFPNYTIKSAQYNDVQLDGSLSSDPDNGQTCNLGQQLTYEWTVVSAPISSQPTFNLGSNQNNNTNLQVLTSSLSNPTLRLDRNFGFNNQNNNVLSGTWIVQLKVSDGTYSSVPTYIGITP